MNRWVTIGLSTALVICLLLPAFGSADEVVIDDRDTSTFRVGDFDCSSVQYPAYSLMPIFGLDQDNRVLPGTITAGDLYRYFDKQGIVSVNQLTFRIDAPNDSGSDFHLVDLNLRIVSNDDVAGKFGARLKGDRTFEPFEANLGLNNDIILPSHDITRYKSEAQFAIDLPYDFMTQFDENSTETITLTVASRGSSDQGVKVAIVGAPATSSMQTFYFVCLFATFWFFVFVILFRCTSPQKKGAANLAQPKPLLEAGVPSAR